MLRRLWGWPVVVALTAVAVVSAWLGGRSDVPAWVAAIIGAVGLAVRPFAGLLKDAFDQARSRQVSQRRLLATHCLVDDRGSLPRLRDLADPFLLGVHRAADVATASAAPTGDGAGAQAAQPPERTDGLDSTDVSERLERLGLVDGVPLYVPRDCDARLERALAQGGLVLLEGPSAAGKSRTGYEVLRRFPANRQLLVPKEAGSLRELVDAGYEVRDTVVWLDDLERFLGAGGLDPHLLHRICPASRTDVVVLATIRSEERRTFDAGASASGGQAGDRQIARAGAQILEKATVIAVRRELSERELRDAEERSWDPRIAEALRAGVGFAEYLAAGPATLQRWHRGRDGAQHVGAAIVSAAVDFRRAGHLRSLPRSLLRDLYPHYLDPQVAHRPDLPSFEEGLAWAIDPVRGASACLTCGEGDSYTAFDYLVARTKADPASRPVPQQVWAAVFHVATPEECLYVGYAAADLGDPALAERAFRVATAAAQPQPRTDAAFNLALVLHDRGADGEAEQWCRVAAEAGHPVATNNVGYLLDLRNAATEAEGWYRRAAELGYPDAMFNLGLHFEAHGDDAAAQRWFRNAADAGVADGAHALGMLAERRGDDVTAECWFRRAGALPAARCALGRLLERRGTALEIQHWQAVAAAATFAGPTVTEAAPHGVSPAGRRSGRGSGGAAPRDPAANCSAVENGPADGGETSDPAVGVGDAARPQAEYRRAASRLGELLAREGDAAGAEAWYLRAADAGSAEAMRALGYARLRGGDLADALRWYRMAAERGNAPAMNDLGFVLRHQGHTEEAVYWWRRCADAGCALALYDLGILLDRQGRPDEAEECYRRGDAGRLTVWAPMAPVPEIRHALDEQAEACYLDAYGRDESPAAARRTDARFDRAEAMTRLGYLHQRRGDLARAERSWRQAAELGNAEAASNVGHLVRDRGRPGEAEQWWRQAADLGHAPAATELGLLVRRHGDERAAEAHWRRAAEAGDPSAMFNLSILLQDRGDDDESAVWWQRATGESTTG